MWHVSDPVGSPGIAVVSSAPADIQAGLANVYGTATDKIREGLGGITVGKFVDKYCK